MCRLGGVVLDLRPKVYLTDDLPPTVGATSGSVTTDTTLKGTEGISYTAPISAAASPAFASTSIGADRRRPRHQHQQRALSAQRRRKWNLGLLLAQAVPRLGRHGGAVDTTAIADGQHTITLKVVDAAQRKRSFGRVRGWWPTIRR